MGMWGEELNRQASTIAYLNDFRVLAVATHRLHPAAAFHAPPGNVRATVTALTVTTLMGRRQAL